MPSSLAEVRTGARAVAPILLGVVPFGLVAGAAPTDQGLAKWSAVGFSTIVFAGASQLAAIDVLGHGGSALVAIVAAWTINLRLVLYSASLAPYLAGVPMAKRLLAAYFLVDQNYAAAASRWAEEGEDDGGRRLAFLLGGGILLWSSWQLSTIAGVLLGGALPEDTPLDFAVPLVFLVLLVPVVKDRPSVAAAVVGGAAAVIAAELGAGGASIVIGSVLGIAAGAVLDRDRDP
jgi:predicted branched-subunit amino acid permease